MSKHFVIFSLFFVSTYGCRSHGSTRPVTENMEHFIETCMESRSLNDFEWSGIVQFVVEHSSWFSRSVRVCDASSVSSMFTMEVGCWVSALEHLLTEPDVDVIKHCACEYFNETGLGNCPAGSLERSREILEPPIENDDCPYVDPNAYADRLVELMDHEPGCNLSVEDYLSVIDIVLTEGVCNLLCDCNVDYTTTVSAGTKLSCQSCWPTRFASMIIDTSPLKAAALHVTNEMDGSNRIRPSSVTCNDVWVTVHVGEEDRLEMGIQSDTMVVISGGEVTNIGDVNHKCVGTKKYNFRFGVTDCGANVVKNLTHLAFTFTMWKVEVLGNSSVVSSPMAFEAACTYSAEEVFRSSRLTSILRDVSKKTELPVWGNYNVTLRFYENDFVTELPNGSNVTIPGYIYTCATLYVNSDYVLQIINCWATDDMNNASGLMYELIKCGAPAGGEYEGEPVVTIFNNANSSKSCFKFRSFAWGRNREAMVYVLCKVRVCIPAITNCAMSLYVQEKRVKRRVQSMHTNGMVTFTGIRVVTDKPSCNDKNGGCSDLCEVTDGNVACRCYTGRRLSWNNLTCYDVQANEMQDEKPPSSPVTTIVLTKMSIFVIICVFAVLIATPFFLK